MLINIAPFWQIFQPETFTIYKEYDMKVWQCVVCGFVYNEVDGLPEEGIVAGTAWADIPENWACPDCGVAKADFEMVEI
jgi:rubredoxin